MTNTSKRAQKLIDLCKRDELNAIQATALITTMLADSNNRVHMQAGDLSNMIIKLLREFKD